LGHPLASNAQEFTPDAPYAGENPTPVALDLTSGSVPGDCDGDGYVTIAEVIRLINVDLGRLPSDACPAPFCSQGVVGIACIETAIDALLAQLPPTSRQCFCGPAPGDPLRDCGSGYPNAPVLVHCVEGGVTTTECFICSSGVVPDCDVGPDHGFACIPGDSYHPAAAGS